MICGLLARPQALFRCPTARHWSHCHYLGHADGLKNTLTPRETNFYENRFWTSQEPHARKICLPCRFAQTGRPAREHAFGRAKAAFGADPPLAAPRVCGCWTNLHALDAAGRELVDTLIRRQAEAGGLVVLAAHEPVPLADQHLELGHEWLAHFAGFICARIAAGLARGHLMPVLALFSSA